MSTKVLTILWVFLIFNSNVSLNVTDLVGDICAGNWTQASKFQQIGRVTKNYKGRLHLTRNYCHNITKNRVLNFPKRMTTYLTAKEKYIFFYITISRMISKNKSTFKIDFNQKWINEMTSKFLLIVWLKETSKPSLNSSYGYEIENIIGEKHIFKNINNLKNSGLNRRQILFKNDLLNTNRSHLKLEINIMATNSSSKFINENITIDSSYIIFCAKSLNRKKMTYNLKDCSPKLVENIVICNCNVSDQLYVDYFVAFFWLFFALLFVVPLLIDELNARTQPNLQIFSSGNQDNSLFHYKITLLLGNVTNYFNLSNSVIDVQFINSEKGSLAPELRFRTSLLKSRSFNEIPINVYRLSEIPEINQICCNHSGPQNQGIFLFGITVETIKKLGNEEPIYRQYIVQKYILRHKQSLSVISRSDMNEERFIEMIGTPQMIIKTIELTYFQIVWILYLLITAFAFISITIQTKLDAYNWSSFLITILVTEAIGCLIGTTLIFVVKYSKQSELIQKVLMNSNDKHCCLRICFYIITFLISLFLQKKILDKGKTMDELQAYYSFSATFFCTLVFTSFWILSHDLKTSVEDKSIDEQSINESENSISLTKSESNQT